MVHHLRGKVCSKHLLAVLPVAIYAVKLTNIPISPKIIGLG